MNVFAGFESIAERALAGERISAEQGLHLLESSNVLGLGILADRLNQRKNGTRVYFNQNRHINPSNLCVNRCGFCAFSRSIGEEGAYDMSIDDVLAAAAACPPQVRELHIVGGLHPDLPFSYYCDLLRALKQRWPERHIKAFTAVEIDYFASISALDIDRVLAELIEAGLGSMPGGGAEIFASKTRQRICPEKIDAERWLQIHRAAHRQGLHSNATMLYGHVESLDDRIDHLQRLRELQDETGMFQAFIPLAYHSENTDMGGEGTSGLDDLRLLAISRIFLDNFDHIKAYWIMLGENIAQVSLHFGVNDLDGTVVEERITHAAGATTSEQMSRDHLIAMIRAAGRTPVERTTTYDEIEVY